jgi:CBS domain-containing protein
VKTATQLLAQKDPIVWTVTADQSVLDAIKLMAEKNIGALLVTDAGNASDNSGANKLIGLLSERDYARKVILKGKNSHSTTVGEIMSSNLVTVGPDADVDSCMALMTKHKIRHLPVLDRNRIVGILSIGDMVKAIIADQQETIQHLEDYIHS